MATKYVDEMITILREIALDSQNPASARVAAATRLLDLSSKPEGSIETLNESDLDAEIAQLRKELKP